MSIFNLKDQRDWLKKCKPILLDINNENPFPKPPIAVNLYNNPPLFCYGRDKYINEILNDIEESINSFQPKLIRVIGKQGIGKSTIICWAAEKLKEEKLIPIIYLETSAQPADFKMKSLYRQIVSKIEKTHIINSLIDSSISKFIQTFIESGGRLEEQVKEKFSGQDIKNLISNPSFINEKIKNPSFSESIFDLLNRNLVILKRIIPVDLSFLLIFWKSHLQNPEIINYLKAFQGTFSYGGYSIQTDSDASNYIDEIINLTRWAFDDESTILIIFDHLEAGISQQKEGVYSNLFSLLLNLRQKRFLTIIISGTLDAYNEFDEILQEDQRLQLDNWSKTIALTNLNPDDVIDIINKYLLLFWSRSNFQPSHNNSLFPFGENSIKYLYENNGLDLRRTLRSLYELIEKYRREAAIEYIDDFFKAFKAFRQREDVVLSYIEQKELRKELLSSKIQDKNRSTFVEKALCKFFDILKNTPDYLYLTDVRHEPPLGFSKKRPDIFLEFFGTEGPEYIKKLGIEIKIYRKGKEISKDDIEKTYLLLKEKALDFVTWITNVPLDIKYRYRLPEELYTNLGRISPLNDLELAYISFIVYFEDIYERKPSIDEVEFILNKINLSPIKLKSRLQDLPKLTEIVEKPEEVKDITSYGGIIEIEPETKPEPKIEIKVPPSIPVKSIEIGQEQIERAVKSYINEKSKTNKQVNSSNTINAIHKTLNLDIMDTKWDEDIWTLALDYSKKISVKQTPKTIYFRL